MVSELQYVSITKLTEYLCAYSSKLKGMQKSKQMGS